MLVVPLRGTSTSARRETLWPAPLGGFARPSPFAHSRARPYYAPCCASRPRGLEQRRRGGRRSRAAGPDARTRGTVRPRRSCRPRAGCGARSGLAGSCRSGSDEPVAQARTDRARARRKVTSRAQEPPLFAADVRVQLLVRRRPPKQSGPGSCARLHGTRPASTAGSSRSLVSQEVGESGSAEATSGVRPRRRQVRGARAVAFRHRDGGQAIEAFEAKVVPAHRLDLGGGGEALAGARAGRREHPQPAGRERVLTSREQAAGYQEIECVETCVRDGLGRRDRCAAGNTPKRP